MTCLKDQLPKVMEAYADVVNNPSFPESELPGVKQRTLAAIESQDADWHQATRFFRRQYFGSMNSPYQFMPIGDKQVVSQATPQQMQQWYQTKILKARCVLTIFGNVDLNTAQSLARQYLGGGEKVDTTPPSRSPDESKPAQGDAAIEVLSAR